MWSEEIELRCSFSFIKAICGSFWLYAIAYCSIGAQRVKNSCIQFQQCCQEKSRDGSVPCIIMSHYCIFDHFVTEISYWMWWPSVLYSSTATHFHIISVSIFWCNCMFIAFVNYSFYSAFIDTDFGRIHWACWVRNITVLVKFSS